MSPAGRRRPWVIAGGIVATLTAIAGGGLAYAVITQQPQTTLQINCALPSDRADVEKSGLFTAEIGDTTGDPIADCRADFEIRGEPAPDDLVAYDDGSTMVQVVPAAWKVPPNWHRLPRSFRIESKRLQLARALVQIGVTERTSRCLSTPAAITEVERDFRELGLKGWKIELLPGPASDGVHLCADPWVDEKGADLVTIGSNPPVKWDAEGTPTATKH